MANGDEDLNQIEILLRIDVELVLCQVWYSLNSGQHWSALPTIEGSNRGSEMTFEYVSTLMSWQAVGPDPAAWDMVAKVAPTDAFTTLHPGLFSGGAEQALNHTASFDYFRFTDNEVWPVNEA